MDGTVIAFLRWFFGLQTVDIDDITVRLNEEGFGDTPIAEVQEALALLADEISDDRQEVLDRAAAHLSAVAAEAMADGGATAASVTVSEASGAAAQSADVGGLAGLPGVTVTTSTGSDSEGAAPRGAPAPSDVAPATDGAPATPPPATGDQPPAHGSAPPPPTYEAPPPTNGGAPGHTAPPGHETPPHHPPPPPGDAPVEYPETWFGYDVTITDGVAYVDLLANGNLLPLEPDGSGGFHAVHQGFGLLPGIDTGQSYYNLPPYFSWFDPATGQQYHVVDLHAGGIDIYRMRLDDVGNFDSIRLTADGTAAVVDMAGNVGQSYDSLDDLLDDYPLDIRFRAEPPPTWAGYDVHNDGPGPYVEIDGQRLYLDIFDDETWGIRHGYSGEYEIRPGQDGALFATLPHSSPALIDHLTPAGFVIPHLQGGSVEFGFQQFTWHAPNGTDITFATPTYEFYGLSATGVVVQHEDGYHVALDGEGGGSYLDPESGETYDTLDELLAGQNGVESPPLDAPGGDMQPVLVGEWGGAEVQQDAAGYYVEIDGVRVGIVPVGIGGYGGQHLDYLLDEGPPLTWANTPDGQTYPVSELYTDGLQVDHPRDDVFVEFRNNTFTIRQVDPTDSQSVTFGNPYEFAGLSETGVLASHPGGYYLDYGFDTFRYIDPGTGLGYDSLAELQAATGSAPPPEDEPLDQVTSGEWGGHEVFDAIDGYYIEIDETRYYLQYDAAGAYINVGGYPVREQAAGLAITVDGSSYDFHTDNPLGASFDIPADAGPVRFVFVPDGGYTFYGRYQGAQPQPDGGWHAVRDGDLIDVPDSELYAYAQNPSAYADPTNGTEVSPVEDGVIFPNDPGEPGSDAIDFSGVTWGGYDVQSSEAGPYIEIDGVQLYLEPQQDGTFDGVVHLGYRLGESNGGLVWTNTPTGAPHNVVGLLGDGLTIAHPDGPLVDIESARTTARFGNVDNTFVGEDESFHGFGPNGTVLIAHRAGHHIAVDGNTRTYVDPETGDHYDSLAELTAATGIDPNDLSYLDDFGGLPVQHDAAGAYVELAGEVFYLEYQGTPSAYVGPYRVWEVDGQLVIGLTGTISPQTIPLDVTNPGQPSFAVDGPEGPVLFVWPGAATAAGGDGGWYELRDGQLIDVPDESLHVYALGYLDLTEDDDAPTFEAAEPADDDFSGGADAVGPGSEDAGSSLGGDPAGSNEGNLEAGGGSQVDDFFSINNAADSVSITHNNGQAQLSIVYSGDDYALPLALRDGGYFVTIGGQEYEVHNQGGTYFVVVDGLAFGLLGNPTAAGWPFDNAMYSIDTSPYAETTAEPEAEVETVDLRDLFDDGETDGSDGPEAPEPATPDPAPPDPAPIEDTLPPADEPAGEVDDGAPPVDDESLETG